MIWLYADGSSTGKSFREFGWGWALIEDDVILAKGFGGGASGSNNTAECLAAINGFKYLIEIKNTKPVTLCSDSNYTLFIANGSYIPKKNLEICKELRALYLLFNADYLWIRGHSGHPYQELCDQLAKQGKALFAKVKK